MQRIRINMAAFDASRTPDCSNAVPKSGGLHEKEREVAYVS
jgi:hypothetical protein